MNMNELKFVDELDEQDPDNEGLELCVRKKL